MINIADLPAVRAQLERAAAAGNEKPAAPEAATATATQARPQRDMVLDSGKYYVTENVK